MLNDDQRGRCEYIECRPESVVAKRLHVRKSAKGGALLNISTRVALTAQGRRDVLAGKLREVDQFGQPESEALVREIHHRHFASGVDLNCFVWPHLSSLALVCRASPR